MKTNLDLARECGACAVPTAIQTEPGATVPMAVLFSGCQLDAFADRIRADEREQCALVAEAGFRFAKDGYQIADEIRGKGKP